MKNQRWDWYWVRCTSVFGSKTRLYGTRKERDDLVTELVTQGHACAFGVGMGGDRVPGMNNDVVIETLTGVSK